MPGELVGQSLAHFRIVEKLGEGGMGVVYKATDEKLGRAVALKLLPEHFGESQERRQRFLREARSAAAVTQANIATVYEVGEADGHVFIAMEFVKGRSLRDFLVERVPVAEALRIARAIAAGLAAAHESGVVHRDLKPENVMVTAKGDVEILDFGLAKLHEAHSPSVLGEAKTDQQITEEGRVLGTPAYMSPEQARGETVDARSDVFSFGVMLYEMLAGVRPFQGGTAVAILLAVTMKEPEPVAKLNPQVEPDVSKLVARCLEKLADARYANAGEIVEALGALVAEPSASGPSAGRSGAAGPPTASLVTPDAASVRVSRGGMARRWWVAAVLACVVSVAGLSRFRSPTSVSRVEITDSPQTNPLADANGLPSSSRPAASAGEHPSLPARRLMALPLGNHVHDAVLSPVGSQLVFIDSEGLWAQSVTGGARKRLGTPESPSLRSVSFLPDGRVLVLGDNVWVVPLDGGSPQALTDRPWLHRCSSTFCDVRVSPDGLRVAITREDGIDIGPFDGSAPVTTLPTRRHGGGNLRFSPDGNHIAYFDWDSASNTVTLIVASIDGKASTKLLEAPLGAFSSGGGSALAWPDASRILFGARDEKEGTCALREIAVDGEGHPTSPPRDLWVTRGDQLVALTTAAKRSAFTVIDIDVQVFVAAIASDGSLVGHPRQLTTNKAQNRRPRWLPDGRIAFFSKRPESVGIYAQGLADAEATLLVEPPLVELMPVVPLVDVLRTGELLYLRPTAPDGGAASRLYGMIPGRSERAFDILTDRIGFALRCATGDPSRCVVAEGSPAVDFRRIDLTSGQAGPRFARSECERPSLTAAPDGKTVAFACQDDLIRIATVAGDSLRTFNLTPPVPLIQTVEFAPSGHFLYVTGMGGKPQYAILAAGLDGRARVLLSSDASWFASPVVSPDGKMMAWHQITWQSEVWVVDSP